MSESITQTDAPWTVGRLLAWTKSHFETHKVDEPRLSAELLLAKALGCKRIELYTRFESIPGEAQRTAFREMVKAASRQEPISYLVGVKEFYSLEFLVTPAVLIPRPDTELLVERALLWCRENPRERIDLLDVGTGSGCIGITLAKRVPAVHVVATDLSEAALAVAAQNAARHGVQDRIRFTQADLLKIDPSVIPPGGFDIVLSNPPYVAQMSAAYLADNVRRFEPAMAIFGGQDGLDLFRIFAREARPFVRPGGVMVVEIGYGQADDVAALFTAASFPEPTRHCDAVGIERDLEFRLTA